MLLTRVLLNRATCCNRTDKTPALASLCFLFILAGGRNTKNLSHLERGPRAFFFLVRCAVLIVSSPSLVRMLQLSRWGLALVDSRRHSCRLIVCALVGRCIGGKVHWWEALPRHLAAAAAAAAVIPKDGVFEKKKLERSPVWSFFCGRSGCRAGHGDSVTRGWKGAPIFLTSS